MNHIYAEEYANKMRFKGYSDIDKEVSNNCKFVSIVDILVIGSVFGAKIANNIPISILKKSFGILMILISLKMIFSK